MQCPLCSCLDSKLLYKEKEKFTNKESFELSLSLTVCEDCGFVFLSNAYTKEYQEIIKKVYKNFDKSSVFPFPNRSIENKNALNIIEKHIASNSNILEIGSNRGDLLYLIKEKYKTINILGIEPTQNQKVYVPTVNGFFNTNLFTNKFDFIIMQHVLEHIVNPKKIVDELYSSLVENGLVYIEVPSLKYSLKHNIEDFMLEHVSYFTKNSLFTLFKNFDLLEINEEPFLKVIFKKSKNIRSIMKDDYRILEKEFNLFHQNKLRLLQEIKKLIQDENEILFFGVSFYFRKLYLDISQVCDIKKSSFIDDNFKEDIEPNFNLQKKDKFSNNQVVIFCSNNYEVQQKMFFAFKKRYQEECTFVFPWNKIIRI